MASTQRSAAAALVLADVTAIAALRHCPAAVWAYGRDLHAWFEVAGPDAVVETLAGAAIWVVALWLAIGLAASSVARVPGVAGVLAQGLSRVMLPRAVRVLLLGTAGFGVLLTPVAAGAAPAQHGSLPAPHWPVAAATADAPISTPALPAPTWPSAAPTPAISTPRLRPSVTAPKPHATLPTTETPATTTPATGTPHHAPARPVARAARASGQVVTVRPGDSLWLLAAHRVAGPRPLTQVGAARVAREWPRWYRANRDVLGADPDLLVPGQVLHAPAATPRRR